MTVSFDIKGLAETEKMFDKLAERAGHKVSIKALKEGAKIVRDKAKMLVPKRTRTLEKSLTIATGKRKGSTSTVYVVPAKGKKRKHDGFYSHFVEFGTKVHKIGNRIHPGTKAHPFLMPAAEMSESQVLKAVGDKLKEEVLKAFKRGD